MHNEAEGCGCLIVIFLVILFCIKMIISFFETDPKEEEERIKEGKAINDDLNGLIYASILEHIETLIEKERQCTYKDDYGNVRSEGFDDEFEYFIKNVVYKVFASFGGEDFIIEYLEDKDVFDLFFKRCKLIFEIVKIHVTHDGFASDFTGVGSRLRKKMADKHIEFPHLSNLRRTASLSDVSTGEDYENYIKDRLEEEGFFAKKTSATGDQGVDLIVQTSNGKVAIQCKYYSSKVGNQAVQEVNAGKGFYNCSYAAVVSNASYTPAARKLAYSLGVCLCDEDSLISLLKEIDAND